MAQQRKRRPAASTRPGDARAGATRAATSRPGDRRAADRTPSQQSAPARSDRGSAQEDPKSASSKLFDLRWLIAAMFVVYGIVLIVTGIFDNKAEIAKAAGVRINLWTGLGMLAVGLFFAAWARMRPLRKADG